MARPAGDINAGSMADIAFLLLTFFMMVTTMDTETGIQRRLPPMPDENQIEQAEQINKRNIMVVLINNNDRLFADRHQVFHGNGGILEGIIFCVNQLNG